MIVVFMADHEVDMCGAEGMSVHHLQEMSCRAVAGDLGGVRCCGGYRPMRNTDRVRSWSQTVQ